MPRRLPLNFGAPGVAVRMLLAGVLLALALWPARARANAGSPHRDGDPAGEPSGALAGLMVEHELLTIDLRPLTHGNRVAIEAEYRLRNTGAARTVDLFFVAAALAAGDFGVWVNDLPVRADAQPDVRVPATWKPPATTPALTDGRPLAYDVEPGEGLRFGATLGSGANTLRVRYQARAAAYSGADPARYWQLGYVLAPARDWASFGQLDVTVLLPDGWRAAAEPSLVRDGDRLTGSFSGLPADTLALTVQAPFRRRMNLLPLAAGGGAALTLTAGALVGVWLGRRRYSFWWLLPVAVVLAAGWTAAVLLAGLRPVAAVPAGQDAWNHGYGRVLLVLLGAPLVFGGGLVLAISGGGLARAVARRR